MFVKNVHLFSLVVCCLFLFFPCGPHLPFVGRGPRPTVRPRVHHVSCLGVNIWEGKSGVNEEEEDDGENKTMRADSRLLFRQDIPPSSIIRGVSVLRAVGIRPLVPLGTRCASRARKKAIQPPKTSRQAGQYLRSRQ